MEKYLSTVEMVGYCAAHAVYSVCDGEVLIPIVGILRDDGQTQLTRLVGGSIETTAGGARKLSELGADMLGACFIRDAVMTSATGKTDCLLIDVRFSADREREMQFVLPYRNAGHADGFGVNRPELTNGAEGLDTGTRQAIGQAFFKGMRSHSEGFATWEAHYLDEVCNNAASSGEENTGFSVDELRTLQRAPFLVFFIVAAADGKVDRKEVAGLLRLLTDAEHYGSPLLIRIVTNIIDKLDVMAASLGEQGLNFALELVMVASIVDERMPAAEALAFKRALLTVAEDIAKASGGLFGFGSRISKAERTALTQIALCLGIGEAH